MSPPKFYFPRISLDEVMKMSPWWWNQCPWKKRHQRIYSLSNHAQLGKAMGGYSKNWQTTKWVSPELYHTITLILDFQFPGLWGYSKNWQTTKWVSPELYHTITLILDFQFPGLWGYSKNWQTMKWVSPELSHTITLILDFQFPGLWENKGLLFKPCLWYFIKTTQAD